MFMGILGSVDRLKTSKLWQDLCGQEMFGGVGERETMIWSYLSMLQ